MEWLIDSDSPGNAADRALALVGDHVVRHAVDPDTVPPAMDTVADELSRAVGSADGGLVHLRLDWTSASPVLEVARPHDAEAAARDGIPEGQPVPARHRAAVRSWPREELARIELPVRRRSLHTFDSGPPPVLDAGLDPETLGPAAVAVALATALEAHPTVSPPQAAAIAGALIANTGSSDGDVSDGQSAAEAFVRLHSALGSEAYVVSADEQSVEVAVSRCPFGAVEGRPATLCHVSSGMAGQLAARVNGEATVLLDEAIVAGDPECHLQVLLEAPEAAAKEGQPYFWPPRATPPNEAVPNLDLSVSLPRESVSVPVVRRLAAQALRAFGVHDEDVDDVQLAITEACANVIDHAAETDTYDVKVELAADRCAITVVDQGSGFDAGEVPERAHDDAEMGRGLALMRALVDNVAFRNEPMAGAVVHMVKSLRYDVNHPLRRS